MKRYLMDVEVRPDPYYPDHAPEDVRLGDRRMKISVTAESEGIARRVALEQIYYNHFLLRKFVTISIRSLR